MSDDKIQCPHCGKSISLNEVMQKKIHDQLANQRAQMDSEIAKRLKASEQTLEKQLRVKLTEESKLLVADLQAQVAEKQKLAEKALANELELLKKTRELENKEKNMDLEVERRLLEERSKISDELRKQNDEEYSLKIAEKDKILEGMKKTIDELKRKSAQGSQQNQGEVLELKIEELLSELFPQDEVVEIKKGARGGDTILNIMMSSGRQAGSILTECKDTKDWGGPAWIQKIKNDMRDRSVDIGVIVSTALPKDIKEMDTVDGIWVCRPSAYGTLMRVLRDGVIKVKRAELAAETPKDQKDFLFQYMTSNKFAQKIQGISEKVTSMKETLESEKRSFQKNWKKRETEIDLVETLMVEMYGELEGVVGKALPKIEALELMGATEDDEEDSEE